MISQSAQKAEGVTEAVAQDFALLLTLLEKKPQIALSPIIQDKYAISNVTKKVKSIRAIPCPLNFGLMP